MSYSRSLLVLLSIALLYPNVASAQTVRIVDAGGGAGTFADIQTAIDAAADGDLVLVKPGTYSRGVINGKGLTLIADGPGVTIQELSGLTAKAGIDILNLSPIQAVNLAGLSVEAGALTFTCSKVLFIEACAGPIQIRNCSFTTKPRTGPFASGAIDTSGAIFFAANAVHIVDSDFDASNSIELLETCNFVGTMAKGLASTNSNVFIYGSTIVAGEGAPGDPIVPPSGGVPGGIGWLLRGGFGLGVRTTFSGGNGGDGIESVSAFDCGPGGNGGAAIELSTPPNLQDAPTFVESSITLHPGVGGSPFEAPCTIGNPGPDLSILAGNASDDDFAPRALETNYLTRVGATKSVKFIGEPFDAVWHVFGSTPTIPSYVPELTGAPTIGNPFTIRFRGVIPPAGEFTADVSVPDFGAPFISLYEEAYFFDGVRFYLSNPQFSVLLDDAF